VSVRGHLAGGPGELVAVDLPPGEHWLEVLGDLWWRGVSVMPIEHRLSTQEKRAIVRLARPAVVVTGDGSTVFADPSPADPVRAAAVVATSGTGGRPRLAELPRRALETALARSNAALGAASDDPWLAVLSPAHIGGFLVYLREAALGTPVAAHPRFEPEALDGTGSAYASVVPTMVRWLVRAGARLHGVTLLVGGAPLEPELRDAAASLGARVVQTYGLTETCGGVAYDGRPLRGTEIRIAGADGEIEVRGPTLMEGYRHDPSATATAFSLDGWLRTADLGALDQDGGLTVHGRGDEVIRSGGEKVWPAEVERTLGQHPKVRSVAVAGRPDPEWGEHVAAWVVPSTTDDPPTLEELREHCLERLARFKAPRELYLVHELPTTTSGKVLRVDLEG
jgi:O-succinylbenzoic acid--CoA ligase